MASSYIVLSRKYRPRHFSDLIGQETLVTVLSHIFETGRLPHALILHGVRGVGKTTTARLLARCLNCQGPSVAQDHGTVTPCGKCDACTSILQEKAVDILEMDAASRTSVDDIRGLIENVAYKPLALRYKVYIIDEVHMLSKSAFNALLKTLEEPPAHVIFIFATTELEKIPETILSRCLVLKLKPVTVSLLAKHLSQILEKEGIDYEERALYPIAQGARGSVRDSLSLLEQAIAYGGDKLTREKVEGMLCLVTQDTMKAFLTALVHQKTDQALKVFFHVKQAGFDGEVFLNHILTWVHGLFLLKENPDQPLVTMSDEECQILQELAKQTTRPFLHRLWQALLKAMEDARKSPDPQQSYEMSLMSLCHLAPLPELQDLMKSVEACLNASSPQTPPRDSGKTLPDKYAPKDLEKPQYHEKDVSSHEPSSLTSSKAPRSHPSEKKMPQTFQEVIDLVKSHRDPLLAARLAQDVSLVSYEPGLLKMSLLPHADKKAFQSLASLISGWLGIPFQVHFQDASDKAKSLYDEEKEQAKAEKEAQRHDPLVQEAMKAFPDSELC